MYYRERKKSYEVVDFLTTEVTKAQSDHLRNKTLCLCALVSSY
jgi:hypothetical protein